MDLSTALQTDLEQKLSERVLSVSPVHGGSINRVCRLDTCSGKYLLKLNSKSAYPLMFQKEMNGLEAIRQTNTIAVPAVYFLGDIDDESYLLMEWIEAQHPDRASMADLGRQVAQMHRHSNAQFGLAEDNYMGSLLQSNKRHDTYREFYINERLQPMVKMAIGKRLLNKQDLERFERLYQKSGELFTEEPPALIHGDLWSGNYLIGADGRPYLIDPAVSYGHREADIALTTLFGGFGQSFYASYNDTYPLATGWQDRLELWNLYALLVHLNLFGLGYLGQVRDAVGMYV